MYKYYKNLINEKPDFLQKYLKAKTINRLRKVDYFCGMNYASKDIYDFSEYISRYDHSLTVALLVYKLTKNKLYTLMGLFHDIGTPVFSHVIDYMNHDYTEQESTEKYTEDIIKNDKYLLKCLEEDHINVDDVINYKNCSIVDNKRPKLCADRLDGVILTSIGWTKNIRKEDILNIIDNLTIFINEDYEKEIGFKDKVIAHKVLSLSKTIDYMCHSIEDNYMMNLLADMTKYAIDKNYLTYYDLYMLNEEEVFDIFKQIIDAKFKKMFDNFKNIKLEAIPIIKLENVKIRRLHPLVNGVRIKE